MESDLVLGLDCLSCSDAGRAWDFIAGVSGLQIL
jgi:hypothetical protein